MYCIKCGKMLENSMAFCPVCGATVLLMEPPATQPIPPVPPAPPVQPMPPEQAVQPAQAAWQPMPARPVRVIPEKPRGKKRPFLLGLISGALAVAVLAGVLVVAGVFSGDGSSSITAAPSQVRSREDESGGDSTPGVNGNNIVNCGMAAIEGDWIYYRGSDGGLYAVRTDGSGGKRLGDDDDVGMINVMGDRVYYLNSFMAGGEGDTIIQSIKTDGSDKRQLTDVVVDGAMMVSGDYIYYESWSDYDYVLSIYRVRADGSGETSLLAETKQANSIRQAGYFNLLGGYIYYSAYRSSDGAGLLYRMKADGSGQEKLCETNGSAFSINILDGYVYYLNSASEIWRLKTDGSDHSMLADNIYPATIHAADGYVYYYGDATDGYSLCRLKADGGGREILNGEWREYYYISIVGDRIFCACDLTSSPGYLTMYTMKTDGNGVQLAEDFATQNTRSG